MTDRVEQEDKLISALLRAALWLDEAAGTIEINVGINVGTEMLKLEAGYARAAALDACVEQNTRNLAEQRAKQDDAHDRQD